jgi:hypothetical protein
VLAAVGACTNGGSDGTADASGPFPSGTGPYVVPADVPDGWVLEQVGRPGSISQRTQTRLAETAVFVREAGGTVFARRLPAVPWGDPSLLDEVDAAADDGRRVFRHPYERGRFVLDHAGEAVEVWGRDVPEQEIVRLTGLLETDLTVPDPRVTRIAVLPSSWGSSGSAVDLVLSRRANDRRLEWLTTVSVTRAEAAALRLLLTPDPSEAFITEPSVYELDRFPRAAKVSGLGRDAWHGMLDPWTGLLVVDGDPGVAVVAGANRADDATRDLELLRQLVPHLERRSEQGLDELADGLQVRRHAAERERLLRGRQLIWEERADDGVTRMLVLDPTPRFAGPDTDETRRRPAPCLAVILSRPVVSAHDGCLGTDRVLAVGEVRTDHSPHTMLREVFGLVDDEVEAVELRLGAETLARARITDLERRVDGRRRLFLLSYQGYVFVADEHSLVALDQEERVLRTVRPDVLGTFEARPGAAGNR